MPGPKRYRLSTLAAPAPLPAATAAIVDPSGEIATSTGRTPLNCWVTDDEPSAPSTERTLVTGPLPNPGGKGNGGRLTRAASRVAPPPSSNDATPLSSGTDTDPASSKNAGGDGSAPA